MQAAGSKTRRLFVAVPIPRETESFVAAAQAMLPGVRGLRLLGPEQWHITLAFIGQADEGTTEKARKIVLSVPAAAGGEALLGGFLLLPSPKKARVIALSIEDHSRVLSGLFESVLCGMEEQDVMQRERRAFRPHLTVARLRSALPLQPMFDCGEAWFRVESVCLYESELRREGAWYKVLARANLTSADGQETA